MRPHIQISALKPADDDFKKHEAVWDACKAANVEVPDETVDYFDGKEPNLLGVETPLGWLEGNASSGDCSPIYRIDHGIMVVLSELPAGTKRILVKWEG